MYASRMLLSHIPSLTLNCLSSIASQNIEYTTMKQLASRAANLRAIHEEERRLVALFWLTQLPVRDERGNFVDVKMTRDVRNSENSLLDV